MNYHLSSDNIYLPSVPVVHRDEEYVQDGFEILCKMQEKHFWYRGRHRFLLGALDRHLSRQGLAAIDLGGGVGGWVRYLAQTRPTLFERLAMADSSLVALSRAASVLPPEAERYQIDLMQLHMHEEWDVIFMLDVIEHLPDDLRAMQQTGEALKPGGLLLVTAPAFPQFWSYNDEIAHHLRRYRRDDYERLAREAGLVLKDARYFMFFLSPLYLLSRMKPGFDKLSREEKKALILKQHAVPFFPVNVLLSAVFATENPLGHWLHFPWGTSILGVFKKL